MLNMILIILTDSQKLIIKEGKNQYSRIALKTSLFIRSQKFASKVRIIPRIVLKTSLLILTYRKVVKLFCTCVKIITLILIFK